MNPCTTLLLASHTHQLLIFLLSLRHAQPMESRTLIPHQVDRFTIFQYPAFIKYEYPVAIVSYVNL